MRSSIWPSKAIQAEVQIIRNIPKVTSICPLLSTIFSILQQPLYTKCKSLTLNFISLVKQDQEREKKKVSVWRRGGGVGWGGSAGAGAGSIITSIPSPWTHEINHIVIVYILFLALQSDFTILFSLCTVSL